MMMKRVVGGLVVGLVLLGGIVVGQGTVQLPPADEEIAAMGQAFGQVSLFLGELITELKGAVAALNAVDADLATRLRDVAAQLRDAEGKIRELQGICADVPDLMTRVNGISDRLDEAWARIGDLRTLAEGLHTADQELAVGITSLAQSLEETRQEFIASIATLGEKVSDLTKQGAADREKITTLEAAALALQSQIEDCQATLRAELGVLDANLSDDLVSLEGSIATLSEQMADHAGRIAALESQDIGSLQRRTLALEQSVQALNIKIENNREKIALLEAAVGGFTSDLKTTIGGLQAWVDDHEARLGVVEVAVGDLDVQALQDGIAMAKWIAIIALLAGFGALLLGLLGG